MFRAQHLFGIKFNPWKWVTVLAGVLLLFDLLTYLWAEGLWFRELGYASVFWVRLRAQGLLGIITFGFSLF